MQLCSEKVAKEFLTELVEISEKLVEKYFPDMPHIDRISLLEDLWALHSMEVKK